MTVLGEHEGLQRFQAAFLGRLKTAAGRSGIYARHFANSRAGCAPSGTHAVGGLPPTSVRPVIRVRGKPHTLRRDMETRFSDGLKAA